MLNLIRLSGPYGPLLSLLAFIVLMVAARTAWLLARFPDARSQIARERASALLFWGSVSAILGFLGQCDGAYRAVTEILGASEISPNVVAEGFAISFLPTLFGLGILTFAVAVWALVRTMAGSRS